MADHQAESQGLGTQRGAAMDRIHAAQNRVAIEVNAGEDSALSARDVALASIAVDCASALVHATLEAANRDAEFRARRTRVAAFLESARLMLENDSDAADQLGLKFHGVSVATVEDLLGAVCQLAGVRLASIDELRAAAARAMEDVGHDAPDEDVVDG